MKEELLRQAQEKFALEIQAIEADYAQQVAYFNMLKAKYEKDMFGHEETLLSDVYDAYTTAQGKVNNLTQQKMQQQVRKAQLEAQVISADEVVKQQIADWNTELKQLQRDLAKLNQLKETQPSKDEYLALLDELEQKAYDIVNNDGRTAKATETSKEKAYAEASKELSNGNEYAFVLAAKELAEIQDNELFDNYTLKSFVETDQVELAEDAIEAYELKWNKQPESAKLDGTTYDFTFENKYAVVSTTVELAELQTNNAFADALETAADNIKEVTGEAWDLKEVTSDPSQDDVKVTIDAKQYYVTNAVAGYIAYYEDAKAKAEKEIERLNTVVSGLEAQGDQADKNALAAYKSQIEYQKALINGGEGDVTVIEGNTSTTEPYNEEGYVNKLADAAEWEIEALADLNEFKAAEAEITELQKEYTAALAEFKKAENQKAYTEKIAALETPAKEYIEAQDAAQGFDEQLADLGFDYADDTTSGDLAKMGLKETYSGSYADIKSLLNGIYDVQDLIDEKNQDIADIQAQIQASTVLGAVAEIVEGTFYTYNYGTGDYDWVTSGTIVVVSDYGNITLDDAIALVDAQIEFSDAKIAAQQKVADKYKAQLDALLASDDENIDTPVEPETPAEDETPSEEQPAA